MFKIGATDEATFYVFGPTGSDPLPFLAIVRRVVESLPDRGLKTGLLLSVEDRLSAVVVAGPMGSINAFRRRLDHDPDGLWASVAMPPKNVKPWMHVTNVAEEGRYITNLGPYRTWLSRCNSGELQWINVPPSALDACFGPVAQRHPAPAEARPVALGEGLGRFHKP